MKDYKISVIIPVYNAEKYIRECLNSIISQTYKNLEIICIDDGSNDDSGKIIKEYQKLDDRIKLFEQKNSGASVARNYGVKKSTGEYISYIDADDFILQGYYEKFIEIINKFEQKIDICSFNANYYNPEKPDTTYGFFAKEWKNCIPETTINNFRDCHRPFSKNIAAWNKIFRKDFLIANRIGYPPNLKYEDIYYYVATMLKAETIVLSEKVYFQYRDMTQIGSASSEVSEKVFDIFEITDMIYKEIEQHKDYDHYKYAAFQFIYNVLFQHYKYCPQNLKHKYFEQMRSTLTNIASVLSPPIYTQLVNHEIYDAIKLLSFEDFERLYKTILEHFAQGHTEFWQ